MPTKRLTVKNDKLTDDPPAIDGRGELHQEDVDTFTGLSATKFTEPSSLEVIDAQPGTFLDLTNIDGDWDAQA